MKTLFKTIILSAMLLSFSTSFAEEKEDKRLSRFSHRGMKAIVGLGAFENSQGILEDGQAVFFGTRLRHQQQISLFGSRGRVQNMKHACLNKGC